MAKLPSNSWAAVDEQIHVSWWRALLPTLILHQISAGNSITCTLHCQLCLAWMLWMQWQQQVDQSASSISWPQAIGVAAMASWQWLNALNGWRLGTGNGLHYVLGIWCTKLLLMLSLCFRLLGTKWMQATKNQYRRTQTNLVKSHASHRDGSDDRDEMVRGGRIADKTMHRSFTNRAFSWLIIKIVWLTSSFCHLSIRSMQS